MNAAATRFAGKSLLGLIAVCAVLAGCLREPEHPVTPRPDNTVLRVYTDGQTGCEYVGQQPSAAGITPRIAADGKTHMGCSQGVQP